MSIKSKSKVEKLRHMKLEVMHLKVKNKSELLAGGQIIPDLDKST